MARARLRDREADRRHLVAAVLREPRVDPVAPVDEGLEDLGARLVVKLEPGALGARGVVLAPLHDRHADLALVLVGGRGRVVLQRAAGVDVHGGRAADRDGEESGCEGGAHSAESC